MNKEDVKTILDLKGGTKIRGCVAYKHGYIQGKLLEYIKSNNISAKLSDLSTIKYKGEYILTLDVIHDIFEKINNS